jgi:hypothetical protein
MTFFLSITTVGLALATLSFWRQVATLRSGRQKQVLNRLEAGEKAAREAAERIRAKANGRYWSCHSTSRALSLAAGLVKKSRSLIAAARVVNAKNPDKAMDLEAQARIALGSVDTLIDYVDSQVTALIGRVRDSVDETHRQAVDLRVAVDELITARIEAGDSPLLETKQRIDLLENALKAGRTMIASAPVTSLRALNTQLRVMNEALRQLILVGSGRSSSVKQ